MREVLLKKNCRPDMPALLATQVKALLECVPDWVVKKKELVRTFKFKNYYEAMAFVNATAWISHHQDHHPDITVTYNSVEMRYSTHSAGGLTENDFICAAKVDLL